MRPLQLIRANGAIAVAGLAIALGVATYALLRPQPAAFLPSGWHRPLWHGSLAAAVGALPTFVHALAISLLTAAVVGTRRRATVAAICAIWCAVELAFEVAQHPAVGRALLARMPSDVVPTAVLAPFVNFVRTGTFDPLDIAAAVLGCITAYAIAIGPHTTSGISTEASHG